LNPRRLNLNLISNSFWLIACSLNWCRFWQVCRIGCKATNAWKIFSQSLLGDNYKASNPGRYSWQNCVVVSSRSFTTASSGAPTAFVYKPLFLLTLGQNELNRVTKCLKASLCDSVPAEVKSTTSWRVQNFTCDGSEAVFGAGKLSLTVGRLATGRIVCISTVFD
jgi:hypothetical protein